MHDRDDLLGADPVVRELDAGRAVDRVEQRLRPEVLEQDEHGGHVLRQRLRDAEDVVLVEEVAVGELGRARHRALLDPGGAGGRVAGERADVGAERDRLLPVEVGRGRDHHVAELVLAHEQQVDDADDLRLLQALELGEDLALEAVARGTRG